MRTTSEQTVRIMAAIEQEYARTGTPLNFKSWTKRLIEIGVVPAEGFDYGIVRYALLKSRDEGRIPQKAIVIHHELKAEATEIIAEILEDRHPMTVRQCFYALVTRGIIKNSIQSYNKVSVLLTEAREKGTIPFHYIVDRTRLSYSPDLWTDPEHFAESVRDGYRKNLWDTQEHHVELWTEKDASYGSIANLLDELGVTVRIGKGYVSATKINESAQRFKEIYKPITVFYLGDFDASGMDIERDIYERHLQYGSGEFTLRRLAITENDIKTFDLPPQIIKETDPRAASFRAKHNTEDCYELDALPVDILRERITEAIMDLVDKKKWDEATEKEASELKIIQTSITEWQRGPANHKQFLDIQRGV